MNELCYFGDDPHEFEPEPGPMECYGCGADEGSLLIYSSLSGLAWCCWICKDGGQCECGL